MTTTIDALEILTQRKSGSKTRYSSNAGRKKRVQRETPEQKALIDWARLTVIKDRRIGDYLVHIPNEGLRGPLAQKEFKDLGGQAGYPDLSFDLPNKNYHGLKIEMKPKKAYKSTVSKLQQGWIVRLNSVGYRAVVCYGFEEAQKEILDYMSDV